MTDFSECLNAVVEELRASAEKLSEHTDRTQLACMMSLLRPYVRRSMDPTISNLTPDSRTKDWNVTINFWDVSQGRDMADLLAECEPEKVKGMDGVREVVQELVEAMHTKVPNASDIPEFADVSLKRRLGGLRPAISRGAGRATLRVYYSLTTGSLYLCTVLVERTEK